MNLNEYKLSNSQREDSLRSIIDPKNDWKVPTQNPYLNPNNPLQENFYGGEPLVQTGPVVEQEPAEEEAEEYEVEHILEKKVKQGKVFYLVKWRGYPVEEATWEPKTNLLHAPLKIKDFESQAYDPLGEAANLKKSKKNPEPESKNKLKSPEPTSLPKTPNMEAALPSQPTIIPNPYMPATLTSKPAVETMGVFMNKEVGNENKNKKKATSNGDVPDKSGAYPNSQKRGNMEEELVRKEGNITQDEINGNRAMTTQRELIKPNGNNEIHPYEKIKNASPEEKEDAIVKMRKLNSDTRELNMLRAEGETLMPSPASLGKMLAVDEKAAQFRDFQQPVLLNKDIAMLQATANIFPSYSQMLKNSSSLQTGTSQFQNDAEYQRLTNGDTTKHSAATTFDPAKGSNPTGTKAVQNQKPSTEEHSSNSQQRTTTKLKKKGPGEPGSFEKGDVPLKVMGIRPMPEINDLEILIDWKAREDGTKPYNSKVRRVDLLKHGHFMPLIEFYESKMRLETAPNFDPKLLTKY